MSEYEPHSQHSITFIDEKGAVIGVYYLPDGSTHENRLAIAAYYEVKDWHHYSLRDAYVGMKKSDADKKVRWYEVDKKSNLLGAEIINGKRA